MDNKKIIGQRINSALALSGKMQKDLAAVLGVTDNTVSYYVGGKRSPSTEQLIEIAKYLGVTSDYLLGLSDTPSPDIEDQAICKKLGIEGETLEALKMVFGTVHGVCMSADESGDRIYSNMIQLFVTASADFSDEGISDFYTRLTNSICDKIEADKIIAEKEKLKTSISNDLTGDSRITATEDTIEFATKSGEDFDVFEKYKEQIEDIYSRLHEAIDKRDASEYRLQKCLMELLEKTTKLWRERYGDTWQA